MTVQIPSSKQHTPPKNGFNQREYRSVAEQYLAESVVVSSPATTDLEITGDLTLPEGAQELGVRLAPALRPVANAALHVVGSSFASVVAASLQKAQIKRFR